ncbi:MAG: hypothetical protein A2494_04245 [Candidatus Lloydbacteria bacterium RIFOXYC12_FULL_46_25]|uniref:Uncharacterized protein n=1 Tax=Candidatus Lloydbacteria bacterium RIFOXYC12_FULL_46_25 TaxID=1798670 RepID=A0A1G2E2R9_9BACT|nr:MAG: hypothetical protein A2494_04245 [Candidatus Lloydbacteria bacterium RIFOXYC12_FULL_46_25]
MTDNLLDARLPLALSCFKNEQSAARKKYEDAPLCKTITDFLHHHGASSIMVLASPEREELVNHLKGMADVLEQTSKELLAVYGVEDESALSGMQRKTYDARMKAVVESLDHYP